MWNKKVILNWLLSLNSKQFIWGFRIAVCVLCVMYGFFFGYVIGLLVILSCLVAFRLPILLIYFNELYLGEFNELPKLWGSFKKSKDEPLSQAVASQPYFLVEDNSLVVDPEVNEAIETFLNGVLEKFVASWQSSLEVKEEFFIIELRHLMKYMILRLYEIVQKVDLSDLLIEKVIPIFLWHLDCYTSGLTSVHSKEIERCALSCIGPNLHPAVSSRKAEQLHLKHYSKQILDCLLPNQVKTSSLLTIFLRDLLGCQILQNAMDALADPDNINKFIILWLEENEALTDNPSLSTDKYIPLLQNFTKHSSSKPADMSMYPNLSSILKTASHLYQFMQFLKREGTLKYLQFLLAVDEFNEKLLNPDLSIEQMKHLQFLGQKMHQNFFSDTSSDCVGFSKESEAQMKLIVYGATKDIVLLRTCPTLFQAYDHVMDILEQKLLFRFYRSPEFLEILTGAQQSGGSSRSSKKKEANPAPGWGKGSFRKLRAALRPGWLLNDTRLLGNTDEEFDTGIDLTEADFIPEDTEVEPDAGAYADLIPVSGRDLTAWRTCIPRVVSITDSSGKQNWGFEVEIQRIDIRPEDDPEEYHWSVVRTYVEFYQLESKLTEFHGEFADIRLKPKKIFGTRSCDFLQSVRAEFESFLRTLLQQPSLKGSDLIFSFLTLSNLSTSQTSGEGGMASNFLDLGLGKMLREVPLKLRKEKGQHLESFIQTYIASTEAPKARPSKVEVRDQSGEVSAPVSSTLHPIFLDNAKTFLNINGKISRPVLHTVNPIKIDGPYDCLLFAAWKIWQIPQLLWNILAGLRSLVNFYFDSFARKFVREKLNRAMQPQKIKMAVKLLQEIVLEDTSSSKGHELEHRRAAWNSIQSAMKKSVPDWLINFVGHQSIDERCKIIFQCLQYPVLNKQLSYVLFDIVLHVLLPEENCTEVP